MMKGMKMTMISTIKSILITWLVVFCIYGDMTAAWLSKEPSTTATPSTNDNNRNHQQHTKLQYTNLVFDGNSQAIGITSLAYIGALKALKETTVYNENLQRWRFKQIAGTSTGCLYALITALQIDPDDLELAVYKDNFVERVFPLQRKDLFADAFTLDDINRSNVFFAYWNSLWSFTRIMDRAFKLIVRWNSFNSPGIFAYSDVVESIVPILEKYKRVPVFSVSNVTFADFSNNYGVNLSCVAANLYDGRPFLFDTEHTPNIPVMMAVYAAMSIPGIYKLMQPSPLIGPYVLIDGSLASRTQNLSRFYDHNSDENIKNDKTLTLSLLRSSGKRIDISPVSAMPPSKSFEYIRSTQLMWSDFLYTTPVPQQFPLHHTSTYTFFMQLLQYVMNGFHVWYAHELDETSEAAAVDRHTFFEHRPMNCDKQPNDGTRSNDNNNDHHHLHQFDDRCKQFAINYQNVILGIPHSKTLIAAYHLNIEQNNLVGTDGKTAPLSITSTATNTAAAIKLQRDSSLANSDDDDPLGTPASASMPLPRLSASQTSSDDANKFKMMMINNGYRATVSSYFFNLS